MSIKHRVFIAFGLAFGILLAAGVYGAVKFHSVSRIVRASTAAPIAQVDAARSAWDAFHEADDYLSRALSGTSLISSADAQYRFERRVGAVTTQLLRLKSNDPENAHAAILSEVLALLDRWRTATRGLIGSEPITSITAPHVLKDLQSEIKRRLTRIVWTAVGRANEASRTVQTELADLQIVAAVVLVLGLVLGIGLAQWFSMSITRPLELLSRHIGAIAGNRELEPLRDPKLLAAKDEMGRVALAFNDMIAELASARAVLISRADQEIEKQFERLRSAVDNMPQGLSMYDADQRLIICNPVFAEIYGLTEELCTPGTPVAVILSDCAARGIFPQSKADGDAVADMLARYQPAQRWNEILSFADGRSISVTLTPLADGGFVVTHKDVTERQRREAAIAHLAHHDVLTGLPNRLFFCRELDTALTRVTDDSSVAVHYLDVDRFKDVNDNLGHEAGDRLLVEVARRLRACTRESEIVARLGGDEFAVIQIGCSTAADAVALSNRIIDAMNHPFELGSHTVHLGASIGVATAPADGRDRDELLRHADLALYQAKAAGRGIVRTFDSSLNQAAQNRRALEQDLRRVIELEQLELHYQPQVDVRTGDITGFEALLRWNHPSRGLVSPLDFIPLAEETGLIGEIGAWVLKEACREAMTWPNQIRVAVNVSPVQLRHRAIELDVAAALGASGLPASRLQVEITEAVLMDDTEDVIAKLTQIRETGVTIAIDDFGTGYSSLSYLRAFPFDKIKIDKSFVQDICSCEATLAIIRAVNNLATSLGVTITAEGVETKDQLALLISERCREVQGFLFSKPRPAHELPALLDGRQRWAA